MSSLSEGSVFAGHRIGLLVGRGGMGEVYSATHLTLERRAALKVINPEYARNEEFRRRFLGESRLAASIDHRHVIPVYDAGEAEGQLYITMRLVEGTDLGAQLRHGPLEIARATDVATMLAGALDAAHARGLVHRDVKPANVLIEADEVFLTDFGLAKQIVDGSGLTRGFVGTPDYAAPEQISTEDYGGIDGRADVYALACVTFHAIAGHPPFVREGLWPKLYAHLNDVPPRLVDVRPGVPDRVSAAVTRAMSKRPADRYGSAGEFAAALRAEPGRAVVPVAAGRAEVQAHTPRQPLPAELSLPCPSGHWSRYPDLEGGSQDFHCPQCGERFTALVGATCRRDRATDLGTSGGKRYELIYTGPDASRPARRLTFSMPTRAGDVEPDVSAGDRFSVVQARGYFHWLVNHLHGQSFWLYPPPQEHIVRSGAPDTLTLLREAAVPALVRGAVTFAVPFSLLAATHVVAMGVAIALSLAVATIITVGNYLQRKQALEPG